MSSKQTRKALFSSFWALLLCFAMLLGTTFAWFTDTASTSVNKIQAGTLDVQLLMATKDDDGNVTYKDISQNSEPIFGTTDSNKAQNVNSDTLWEPGKTQVAYLAVKNNGNLALKYKMCLVVDNVSKDLYKAMKFAVVNATYGGVSGWNEAWGKSVVPGTQDVSYDGERTLPAGEMDTFALVIHMDENAGNEYQGGQANFDLTVLATQATSESDSFSNQYDANATYPAVAWDGTTTEEITKNETDGKYHLSTAAQFATFVGGSCRIPADSTVVLDCDVDLGGATITGYNNGVFDSNFDGQGHTISNFTVKTTYFDNDHYCGLFPYIAAGYSVKNLNVKDAVAVAPDGVGMVGIITGAVYENATVENCHVENCIVVGEKKVGAVAGYTNGTVKDCSATDCAVYCKVSENEVSGGRDHQAGEIVGYTDGNGNVTNCSYNEVTVTFGTTPTFVSSAAELTAAVAKNTANVSVVLMDDITMTSDWTPIDIGFYGDYKSVSNLTINGNGHTVSGLTSALVEKVSANCSVTINDLTVKDATVSNSSYTNGMGNGLLVGYVENGNVTLNNCKVADSSITESSVAAAALIGYVSGNSEIKITNCEVKNTNVAGDSAAGFIGYVQQAEVTVSGCKVSGGSFTGEKAEKQGAYFGTVNVGTTANISNTTADTTALVGRILSTGAVNYN